MTEHSDAVESQKIKLPLNSPAYRLGWKHGFIGAGPDPDLVRNMHYAVGLSMGREMDGHLDGFFFFKDVR